jgi:TetR/AcrR family transcriptional regulator, transcriptional repressor for nem operon
MASHVREKVVSAAVDRFHALGYCACGVQEIVDKAGVPKGSFYNHFKSKELLAVEVLEIYAKGTGREMLSDTTVAPVQRLRGNFEFMASRHKRWGYSRGSLIGNLAAETSDTTPLIRRALAQAFANWTSLVADTIREGQSDGSVAGDLDAEGVARFLINSWEGAVIRTKIADSREPLDDFFTFAFPLLSLSAPHKPVTQTASPKRASGRSSLPKSRASAPGGRKPPS